MKNGNSRWEKSCHPSVVSDMLKKIEENFYVNYIFIFRKSLVFDFENNVETRRLCYLHEAQREFNQQGD